ncbi:MAG: KAP family NTPase [Clostridium sp.]|nr:KAP family NTPase [Clostridium sp.]
MFEHQIIEEVNRYLKDDSYQYAILIDGEWGCGKTYFVKHILLDKIKEFEQNSSKRTAKYISLYGCKTIQDIQEAMVWVFAEEAKNFLAQRTTKHINPIIKNIPKYIKQKTPKNIEPAIENILSTSKRVLNKVREKFLPDVNVFEFTSDWFLMKDFIFIFDDLERCDCPINELFGFINGLVEHENTKVILIANEKEISMKELNVQKELQYFLALNDKIEWKKKENSNNHYHTYNMNNGKIKISELEDRRKLLFSDEIYDGKYKKIREKLIGITLHYQPNVREICKQLIANTSLDNTLAKELDEHIDIFYNYMNQYSHHNLRTFQFYISKISYLCQRLAELSIDDDYFDAVMSFLIQDCFIWAIEFKSEFKPPTDDWQKIHYDVRPKSSTVKKYVETGEFVSDDFKSDINKYINEQLREKLSNNDPVNQLYNGYYYHTQEWCEEQIQSIKDRLSNDKYPFFAYQKIIITLQRLIDIGFSSAYLNEFKSIMLNNINNSKNPVKIDSDLFFVEDKIFKEKILSQLRELNNAIAEKSNLAKEKSIIDILNSSNWAHELDNFVSDYRINYDPDGVLFNKAPADIWVKTITNSNAADIDEFRHILGTLYSTNTIRSKNCLDDLSILKDIGEAIIPKNYDDLIIRANLGWLKKQIASILELYQKRLE